MTQSSTFPVYAQLNQYALKELLVAYDFSEAADSSLKYAVALSRRFGSYIHLIGVQTPADYASALEAGPLAMELAHRDLQWSLKTLEEKLRTQGIWADSVRRVGSVSDTIEAAILEHTPDLLLLGAFGYGRVDRPRLGSTAEHLLRTVHCPVLILGPRALLHDREAPPIQKILCAVISDDSPDGVLSFAGRFATQLGAELELVHVIDPAHREVANMTSDNLRAEWAARLREHGTGVTLTLVHGIPDDAVARQAAKSKASLILFGLHRTGNKSVDCADGVVSATIREAHCPVMTVPAKFL